MPHLHVYTFLYTFAVALSAVGLVVLAVPFALLGTLLAWKQSLLALATPIRTLPLDSSDAHARV